MALGWSLGRGCQQTDLSSTVAGPLQGALFPESHAGATCVFYDPASEVTCAGFSCSRASDGVGPKEKDIGVLSGTITDQFVFPLSRAWARLQGGVHVSLDLLTQRPPALPCSSQRLESGDSHPLPHQLPLSSPQCPLCAWLRKEATTNMPHCVSSEEQSAHTSRCFGPKGFQTMPCMVATPLPCLGCIKGTAESPNFHHCPVVVWPR